MPCKLENINDKNLQSLVQKYGAKEGLIKFLSGETITAQDISEESTTNFPFTKESIEKILSGEKTITVRSKPLKSGNYLIGDKNFKVDQQGLFTLDEYLELTGLSKSDFRNEFIQDEEVKEDHIKRFLNEDSKLFIYKISPTQSANNTSQSEIKRLEGIVSNLENVIRKISDPDRKDYYRDKLKKTKDFIKFISVEENQTVNTTLNLIEAEIGLAEDLVENGDTLTALHYINFYQDLLPTDLESEELNIQRDLILKRVGDLKERISKIHLAQIANSTTAKGLVDANGKIVPFVQDKSVSSSLYDISTSNSQFARELYRRVTDAINKYTNKITFTRREITKLTKAVKEFQKGLSKDMIWDFMLQVDSDGKRTGYTVDRYNWKYYKDKKENYVDRDKDSNKDLNKKLDWLRNNHNITVDEEVFNKYKENRVKYITDQEIVIDESKYTTPEEIENAINNVKLDKVARMSYRIDANNFVKILNKKTRSAKELEFIRNYYSPSVWKSFGGKPILNYEVKSEDYIDSKYDAIMNLDDSNPLKNWFQYYTNTVKAARMEANDWEHDNHLALNYIPELKLEANLLKQLPDWLKDSFTELPEYPSGYLKDPITNEPLMTIHDAGMLSGNVTPQFKNYDLEKVLDKFIDGHYAKKYKSSVEDEAKIILSIIKSQPEYELDSKGEIIKDNGVPRPRVSLKNNAFEAAKYHIEATLYDKRQKREGELSTKYYDSVTQEEIDHLENKAKEEELTKEEVKRLEDLEKKATVTTTKKGVNSLISYTAIKALALNPFSGIAETVQSFLSLYVESAGSKFFNSKDLINSYGESLKLMNPTNKSEQDKWFSNFPLINGYGYEITKGFWSKTFVGFEASEKLNKGAMLFAYLKNKKVTDKQGVKHSLKEVLKFNEEGVAYLDDRFEDDFGQESKLRNEVINELSSISKKLMSRDNTKDPIQLSKSSVGRLLGQFRASWMFEGFLRRWGSEHEDAILGTQKGYYRSVFITNGKVDIPKAMDILWTAWKNPDKLAGKYGIQDLDVNNVKKALRELQIFTTLLGSYLALSLLGGDDDDEESFVDNGANFLINISYRANRDLTFYINPKSTTEIFDSPAAAMTTVKQLLQFTQDIVETPFDPYVFEGTKRERLKAINSGSKLIPLFSGANSTWKKIVE